MLGGSAPSRTVFASVVLCAALVTAACTPAATVQPPRFTSAEQAFAAAEQTYWDYVDALNQVDLADPATFDAPLSLTTGSANSTLRAELTTMNADGWVVSGDMRIELASPAGTWSKGQDWLKLNACLRLGDVMLVDKQGKSRVNPNRLDVQPMVVTFTASSEARSGWLIRTFESRTGAPEC